MKLKELLETSSILDSKPATVEDAFITGGEFKKVIDGDIIMIKNAREYIKITPQTVVYGYTSKYDQNCDQHHMEVRRVPWQYIDDNSNVTPSIAIEFINRYLDRLRRKKA